MPQSVEEKLTILGSNPQFSPKKEIAPNIAPVIMEEIPIIYSSFSGCSELLLGAQLLSSSTFFRWRSCMDLKKYGKFYFTIIMITLLGSFSNEIIAQEYPYGYRSSLLLGSR